MWMILTINIKQMKVTCNDKSLINPIIVMKPHYKLTWWIKPN